MINLMPLATDMSSLITSASGTKMMAPLVRGGAKRFLDEITGGNVQGKFPRILDDERKAKLLVYVRVAAGA